MSERIRHKERGTTYRLVCSAEAQVSTGRSVNEIKGVVHVRDIRDGDFLTVYQSEHDGKLWVRFSDEMIDGRFETIEPSSELCRDTESAAAREREPAQNALPREVSDALQESAYLAGAKAGWNLGISEDMDGMKRLQESRSGYLKPLREWQEAGRPTAATADLARSK